MEKNAGSCSIKETWCSIQSVLNLIEITHLLSFENGADAYALDFSFFNMIWKHLFLKLCSGSVVLRGCVGSKIGYYTDCPLSSNPELIDPAIIIELGINNFTNDKRQLIEPDLIGGIYTNHNPRTYGCLAVNIYQIPEAFSEYSFYKELNRICNQSIQNEDIIQVNDHDQTINLKPAFSSNFGFGNKGHERYAPKLAALVDAWYEADYNSGKIGIHTPKKAIIRWLEDNLKKYGIEIGEKLIEEMAAIANWSPKGGAPRTPVLMQKKQNK